MAISTLLPFAGLPNTRDLGGMTGADGRKIKSGLLLRSGRLALGTAEDIAELEHLGVCRVYDFRSEREFNEQLDPPLRGAEFLSLPVLRTILPGVARDSSADRSISSLLVEQRGAVRGFGSKMMQTVYDRFVRDDYARGQYRVFLNDVLAAPGPVLWHCAAGKDRAGFAAVLLQTLLGVNEADIRTDYLFSNVTLAEDCRDMVNRALAQLPAGADAAPVEVELTEMYSARDEYLDASLNAARAEYGGLEGYLREGLGITDEMRERFREKYLEA